MGEHDAVNYNSIAVIVGVIAVIVLFSLRPMKEYIGGIKMKQKRRGEIHTLLTGGFTDFIEDCVASGNITREEARLEGYDILNRLYPKVREIQADPNWLKERIDKRMKSGAHAAVTLPDVQVVMKRKHLFDKG